MGRAAARRVAGLCGLLLLAAGTARAEEPVRIGWTTWADGVFVTRLAARIIETELREPVELVRAGIAEQYQGLASGRLDVTLMSWQPRTHGPYLDRVGPRTEDLGVLYHGARLGWAVPDHVPAEGVASIADLRDPAVRERLGGRIVGIDPGAGLMRLSRRALARYRLDGYALEQNSGPAMTAALDNAAVAGDWIVVTAWSPHWIFAAHGLRYLEDPKGVLGGVEQVHAVAREGFHAERPRVAALLGRLWLPLEELEKALLDAREDSVEAAVTRYIEQHPDRVRYWVTGEP
jgi:glycine betaine/proline transport system substrate-binding protein